MQAWEEFVQGLSQELGSDTVTKWLRPLRVVHFDACNLYLEAKDSFHALWFEEHIRPRLKGQLLSSSHKQIRVHLSILEEEPTPGSAEETRSHNRAASSAVAPRFAPDLLEEWASLETFVAGSATEPVLRLMLALCGRPLPDSGGELELGLFNPIFLYGPSGVGKTHLLMATAKDLIKRGLSVMYVRTETFTEHVVRAIRSGLMQPFRTTYRSVDVLILDDVQQLARRSSTQEELFHTFNTLHTAGKQIILASSLPPHLLTEIEPRLVSRFEWGISLPLQKLSETELFQVLKSRCQALQFPLPEEALHFLIQEFGNHTKSLHRAFEALLLRSHLQKLPSAEDFGKEQLKRLLADLLEQEQQIQLSPEKIVKAVAEVYGITTEDVLGRSQAQEFALPRQVAMHLCRFELKLPYPKIGAIFSRDHSTAMASVKNIEKRIATGEPECLQSLHEIKRKLETTLHP